MNVARTLGGSVQARNRADSGAVVTITLPLASIVLPETTGDTETTKKSEIGESHAKH